MKICAYEFCSSQAQNTKQHVPLMACERVLLVLSFTTLLQPGLPVFFLMEHQFVCQIMPYDGFVGR
jgi:hypothetical protein